LATKNQTRRVPMVIDSNTKIRNYENVVEEFKTVVMLYRQQGSIN